MKLMIRVVTGVLLAQGVVSFAQQGPPPSTAIVSGRVIDRDTRQPIADAVVVARTGSAMADEIRTDRDGQFVFTALPAGATTLGAVKAGYQGSGSAGRPVQLTLKSGDRVADAVVALARFSAFGGTVRDQFGEPVVGINVQLLRYDGRGRWSLSLRKQTDDRGSYRFSTLAPGDYRIWVPSTQAPTPGRFAFLDTFAPSGTAVVTLQSGETRGGVDLALTPAPAGRIRGHLVGAPGAVVGGVKVNLALAGVDGADLRVDSQTTDPAGRFEFRMVPAGSYELSFLHRPPSPPSSGRPAQIDTGSERIAVSASPAAASAPRTDVTSWGIVPLVVNGEDLDGLEVGVRTGHHVSGRVVFEGASAPPATVPAVIRMLRADTRPEGAFLPAVIAPDLTFVTPQLPSARYVVWAGPIGVWNMRRAELNGRDVSDAPFELDTEDVGNLVVTYTDRLASISGDVRMNDGAAATAATVVAFPKDRAMWNADWRSRRFKSVRADTGGAFRLTALPSGNYLVAAIGDDAADRWMEIPALTALAKSASDVSVNEGDALRLDLQMPKPRANAATVNDVDSRAATRGHGPFVNEDADTPPDDPQAGATPLATITGQVRLDDPAGTPLRGVLVAASGANVATSSTFTDGDGRFELTGPQGQVARIVVSKPAFLTMEFGAKAPGRPGTAIVFDATHPQTLDIRMTRGAVIAGHVSDAHGAPMPGVAVRILKLRGSNTDRELVAAPEALPSAIETDDLGNYRAYGLPPGDYLVGVTAGSSGGERVGRTTTAEAIAWANATDRSAPPPAREPARAFTATFHPSSVTLAGASPVRLAASEERQDVNVSVQLVTVSALSGQVLTAAGQPAVGARILMFPDGPYVPSGTSLAGAGAAVSHGGAVSVAVSPAGRFSVSGLRPGEYTVFARGVDAGPTKEPQWSTNRLTVGEQPGSVTITMAPALTLHGRVTGGPGNSRISVGVTSVTTGPMTASVAPVAVAPDGTFAIRGILPGQYWLDVRGVPPGSSVVAGRLGDRDVLDQPLELSAGATGIDIALTLGPASGVTGQLTTAANAPATDFFVVAFSASSADWIAGTRRIRAVRPSTDGHFVFDDLPPGEYRLAALRDIEPGEWFDRQLLDALVPASVPVTVTPGARTAQDLRIGVRY